MSKYFDRLERHLLDAVERQSAARRGHALRSIRAWLGRRRPRTIALLAVLLLSGSAAIAATILPGERSLPLSSTKNATGLGFGYTIKVAPRLKAGSIGWCEYISHAPAPAAQVLQCGDNGTVANGALLYPWTHVGTLQVVLTAPQVAAVHVEHGPTVLTRTAPGLPSGFRVAVFAAPRALSPQVNPRRLLSALNSRGQTISTGLGGSQSPLPTTAWLRNPADSAAVLALFIVYDPTNVAARPRPGACSIRPRSGSALTVIGTNIVTKIVADPHKIIGRAFLDCDDTAITNHGTIFTASLVLDAAQPGADPAPLPNTTPLPSSPGTVYSQPLARPGAGIGAIGDARAGFSGMAAHRVGDAWLVVEGGTTNAQRLDVLRQLTVGPIVISVRHLG
jgi:hypothetical protein